MEEQNLPFKAKTVAESAIRDQVDVVFPNDLNTHGTLFGGRVLEKADRLCAIVAKRHTGKVCVTLAIDSVRFLAPAKHGDILILQASINRVWNTSMEIGIRVTAEDFKTQKKTRIFSAYFTFVCLDDQGRPVRIPPVVPISEDEKRRYDKAEIRRKHRLLT